LEKERRVVLQELNARLNSPSTRGSDVFFQTVFAQHPARHLPGGSRETVLTISRDDLLAFRQRWFLANNMAIAVVGNLAPAEAARLVEQYFGRFRRRAAAARHRRAAIPYRTHAGHGQRR
jgi:zinc protease